MSTLSSNRIASLDILRGLVMILMTLDHVRDFFHETALKADPMDPAGTTLALYFTRWMTHFCAPAFVLLAGVSAYLGAQFRPPKEAALLLIKRGIWLIIAEILIVTLGISFDPFYRTIILQVIWAIGWSMILLGLLIRTSFRVILVTGIILVAGHNLLDMAQLPDRSTATGIAWQVLLTSPGTQYAWDTIHRINVIYAILPWTGIMLLGYCLGVFYKKGADPENRKWILLYTGTALTVLFVILRVINVYGNPTPWHPQQGWTRDVLAFLNTSKYPPSLQYTCMTLGPVLLALLLLEKARSPWARWVAVFGSVPFFYYVLHFFVLHACLAIVYLLAGYPVAAYYNPAMYLPFCFRPINFGYSLPVVYLIWISAVIALYFPTRWFARYKQSHRQWWLKYV
ncbi:DUF1624 domain-containing protein [Chitinophaga nivalis]|uniref:Heparan-alpha-glucosaminide N-acetyltransferase domain-containing protein n=1 Tax=Chitinophaga nivalis TaxID=2991709 RepID=A0ABT3ILW7_9BACT|nr:heparan-alpha-glucosaminide N-acetyltransferase domain-containing protein [Chitinophaga nivalis]MCW3465346.1 heparan-alpha-glucosaminide N-acetyltransferase domain-containing protein [Chitinophaga nivalis]MCW3484962.1 heparan-alpha-glucosaminide N-acetyltransferase domain-containing protein [Chitinophaga nivalis]